MAPTNVVWALESADAYPVRMTDPGANVTHGVNDNVVTRANAEGIFGVKYRDFEDERTMDHALVNRLYEILGPFAIDLKDESRALGTPTFL